MESCCSSRVTLIPWRNNKNSNSNNEVDKSNSANKDSGVLSRRALLRRRRQTRLDLARARWQQHLSAYLSARVRVRDAKGLARAADAVAERQKLQQQEHRRQVS